MNAAAQHLDLLAHALHAAGWATRIRHQHQPILHVFDPLHPQAGESVRAQPDHHREQWCYLGSVNNQVLAPVNDIPAAVTAIELRLTRRCTPRDDPPALT